MKAKIQELLAVLNLTEKTAVEEAIAKHLYEAGYGGDFFDNKKPVYADYIDTQYEGISPHYKLHLPLEIIAFRLRGEVPNNYQDEAICLVHEYVDKGGNRMYSQDLKGAISWFCFLAQPIHWIIAALIAKRLAKGE